MTTHHPQYAEAWEWDEGNEQELSAHRITPTEVREASQDVAAWLPNKKGRAGDWLMVGTSGAGRHLSIVISYDERRMCVRAVTGWDSTTGDVTRYFA